jgi:hypothetical protein
MGVAASEGVKPSCPAKPQRDAVMTAVMTSVMTSGMASGMAKVASTVVAVGTVPRGRKPFRASWVGPGARTYVQVG